MKSTYQYLKTLYAIGILLFASSLHSCKKLVDVSAPVTSLNAANVYQTDATAIAVLTGIYTNFSSGSFATGSASISEETGLSSDELTLWSGAYSNTILLGLYQNALSAAVQPGFFDNLYQYIYKVNDAISGLSGSNSLTPSVKKQLLGEAYFLRAFLYSYLVEMYGDVPLALTTNYKANTLLPRSPKSAVWQQIIIDLKNAQGELSQNYVDGTVIATTTERVRPNYWVATALLARVYLYIGDWSDAATQATVLINNTAMYQLASLASGVFNKNSSEAIWQLQPVTTGYNTADGRNFVLPSGGPSASQYVYLSNKLLSSFEAGDQRYIKWIGSITVNGTTYYYPFKYKVGSVYNGSVTSPAAMTEYSMVLRLAEQYLIRAEAEAELGQTASSASDLNAIRTRAGLPNTTAATQSTLLAAILHERQVELFTEWGHRWFDLNRTGTINSVMGPPGNVCQSKGGTWNSNWALYPIPILDLQNDPNLTQNPGY